MARVSEIREETLKRGYEWTADRYQYAIDKGAEKDEDFAPPKKAKATDINPGFVFGPQGMQFNPLAANVAAGAARGATAGFADAPMVGPTGGNGMDRLAGIAGQAGELMGMAATTAMLPTLAAAGRLPGMLARMAPAAVKGAQYGAASGVAEGVNEGASLPEVLKSAATGAGRDALMFGGLAGIPKFPAWLGGAYGQSAAIGAGMGAATGGAEGALAGALAFPLSHAVTGPALEARPTRRPGAADARSETPAAGEPTTAPGAEVPATGKQGVKKDNLLAALFLPSQVQISRQSPEARKVGELLRAGKSEPKMAGGPFARKLVENRAGNLSEKDAVAVQQAIQGFRDPETLSPEARNFVPIAREYLADVATRAGGEGMQVKTFKDGRVPFPGPNETYFPRIQPKIKDLKSGATRKRVIENAVFTKQFETPAEAEVMLDSYVDIVENGGNARNRAFADKMVRDGKAASQQEAFGLIEAHRNFDGPQRFGSAEFAREFDNPFYEPDFNKAISQYSKEMERRIAETRNWGQDNERLDEAIAQIKSESERRSVRSSADVARGEMQKGDVPIDAAARVMRRFGSFMMSPLSAIRNTGQANNTLLATTFKDAVVALRYPATREGRLFGVESGATAGPVLRDVEAGKGGAPSYQKIIGQTGTEVLLRSHAAGAAKTYLDDMATRIRKNPNDKFAAHEIRKMGHDPADLASRPTLTRADYLRAGFNISDRTQFGYDELDVPAWFNRTEPGKTVSQFRPWVIQQSRLIYDETVGQWQGGTWEGKARAARNVALMATLYPMTGEVLNDVIALIQGKKRTSNLFLRYLEDSAQMGVLTVASDIFNAVQYDNAEGLMMGASASKAKDMATIAGRLAKNNGKLSYSDKRLLFRMTPIMGPLFAYRLFPKKEEGSASNASDRPTRRAIPKR